MSAAAQPPPPVHSGTGTPFFTELRVHGVSATPPQTMLASPGLEFPTPVRVAGDDAAGFYHREFEDPGPWDRVEAFSWGGLTSGGKFRALWLLLTPFMIANVAFWASPVPLAFEDSALTDPAVVNSHRRTRRVAEAIHRLFALSLTASTVLGAITVAMDVIGWQYAREQQDVTAKWLFFMTWPQLSGANVRLAVSAAAPLLLVMLLWYLGHLTWARLETRKPASVTGDAHAPAPCLLTPLEDRRMWNGRGPVGRLRSVHVAFAIALIGLAMLAPLLLGAKWSGSGSILTARPFGIGVPIDGGLLIALLILLTVLICEPALSDRPGLDDPERQRWYAFLPWIALVLAAIAAAVLMFSGAWAVTPLHQASTSLPGIVNAISVLFIAQAALIVAMAVVTGILGRFVVTDAAAVVPPVDGGTPANLGRPWLGMAPALLSTIAWLLCGSWSAACTLFIVKSLGRTVASSATLAPAGSLVVPASFVWAAAATFVVVVVSLLIVGVVAIRAWATRPAFDAPIAAAYALADVPRANTPDGKRFSAIRLAWLFARLPDDAEQIFGAIVLVMWVTLIVGVVWYIYDDSGISSYRFTYQLGAIAILIVGGVMVWLGRRAYSNPDARKKAGILWDVGSFWPRATHPLAPPCYAERAVPDLMDRTRFHASEAIANNYTAGSPAVLLSCHSQGSVIGAAAVLQMEFRDSAMVSLLTYGSPLRRLYSRCFPAYFGPTTLCRIGALLHQGGGDCKTLVAANLSERITWRWRNLYRPTDPIGGPTFVAYPVGLAPDDIDRNLCDPVTFDRARGDTAYPPANAHSGYPLDAGYATAVAELFAFDDP